jgi:hypothetical protein
MTEPFFYSGFPNRKRHLILLGYFVFIVVMFCYAFNTNAQSNLAHPKYIFFLHNRFIELNELSAKHPEYGRAEYNAILDSFKQDGFIVISEKRAANTEATAYAKKIVTQIDSLIQLGIPPNQITVIGTSKGGYIAQYVSTYLANPSVNYVFIGCFSTSDIQSLPEINFCGNILCIYELSDAYATSAESRRMTSKLKVTRFKEIALNTGLKHGFLFKLLVEWLNPCKMWAIQNYNFDKK